jgi:hypothetical protein
VSNPAGRWPTPGGFLRRLGTRVGLGTNEKPGEEQLPRRVVGSCDEAPGFEAAENWHRNWHRTGQHGALLGGWSGRSAA